MDVLYLDEDILILRGHQGQFMPCAAVLFRRDRAIGGDVPFPSNTDVNKTGAQKIPT